MRPLRPSPSRPGVTTIELIMVFVIIGIVTAVISPRIGRSMGAARMERARHVIQQDLQYAAAAAARQRRPVRLIKYVSGDTVGYKIHDRADLTKSLRKRDLGRKSDYNIASLTFSRDTVYFFPNGLASSSLSITLRGGDSRVKTVTMTKVGFVRMP